MNQPLDPNILWLLVGICVTLFLAFCLYVWHNRVPEEEKLRVEAQRRMLRFCKEPTHANFVLAWAFIEANNVQLTELDWPLVQRFTRTAAVV